jgi:4-amino-4-deoxy-L-arabinose transferase-like glycosyltransferase
VRFALCWLIPTWLVFEILPTKLVHYTLPAVPALAMLMAAALRAPLGNGLAGRRRGAVGPGRPAAGGDGDLSAGRARRPDRPAWTILTALLFLAAGVVGAVLLMRKTAAIALVAAGRSGHRRPRRPGRGLFPRLEPLLLSPRLEKALERADLAPRGGAPGPWPSPAIPSPA